MFELLITSSVLILLICLIRVTFKGKMNLKVQYALWLIVVLRLIPVPLIPGIEVYPIKSSISVMNLMNGSVDKLTEIESNQTGVSAEVNSINAKGLEQESDGTSSNMESGPKTALIVHIQIQKIYEIAMILWYVGIACGLLWFIYVNLQFRKFLLKNRKKYKLEHSFVPVYVVVGLKTPCIFLIHRKYAIYITKEVSENKEQLNHVMLHEYCHYRHFDHIWSFVRCILLIFYWYNPLVWVAAVLSKRDAELACDAAVIEQMEQKECLSYGITLVDIAVAQQKANVFCLGNGMAESKRGLKERIQCIVKKPKMMIPTCILLVLLIGILIGSTFTTSESTVGKENDENSEIIRSEEKDNSTDSITNEDAESRAQSEQLNELYSLLEGYETSIKVGKATIDRDFDYYRGLTLSQLIGVKQIYSMKDITDQAVIDGASAYYAEMRANMSSSKYINTFKEFTGIDHYLTITLEEESSLILDYVTTTSNDDFKLALQFPNDEVVYVEPNTKDTYVFPKGVSYIALCGYKASGEVTIGFEEVEE